ncbi:hypothetical protein DACRYDRAFT_25062 [Dacryopinax primogenitus]|uniref:SPX-domain-containing protein n=1 Tax=Dacryopinax primogenitus (strain DJM 731) TaxID=1858805 RepID=M5FNN1_DACPD|nr:uncharacterized protein DACRYDRAFT_25062 [Dacryopinax primogenitus]EJT97715.1 hypothetical protein DACRYDRAFT_25062 [Dacryopinax primogenitus]
MKFGKEIQAQQIPGWSRYYLDYKFLKKIINSLAANRPASEAAALAAGIRPSELPLSPDTPSTREEQPLINPYAGTPDGDAGIMEPPLWGGGADENRGPIFKAHRKAFFFKLERELEKINEFYLQKENELRLRLGTLLSKQQAAMERSKRNAANSDGESLTDSVEWRSIEEGFRVLQKDLLKLQQFIEINATGFRKILKKWDKRSKSHTKELYLSRQVEVQPCFNRHLLAELSNIVSAALVDLQHAPEHALLVNGDIVADEDEHRTALERQAEAAYADFESNLSDLVVRNDEAGVRALLPEMDLLLGQAADAKTNITRILSRAIIEAPPHIADLLISSTPFDFSFVDDISGRTCLHETAIAGERRLVQISIDRGVAVNFQDVYGRTALHYASMNGHVKVCEQLLAANVDVSIKDSDNCTALVYAVMKGKLDCVKALLCQPGVDLAAATTSPDEFNLLSLACQYGQDSVARLLVDKGARPLPNSNGEYPIHLAAREGHAELCRIFAQNQLIKDVPDRYSEWTPLFHAARNGHEACVRVLLESGCNANARDESGKMPIYYAGWYGHTGCVNLLLQAGSPPLAAALPASSTINSISPASQVSDTMQVDSMDEIDNIPSLFLPPPAMPLRIYGHTYLNRSSLVQIALGRPFAKLKDSPPVQAVQLQTRVTGAPYVHSGPSLKLIMATRPNIAAAPHTVILPLQDEMEVYNFQLDSLDDLSLEFSLYPAFGSKLMGRAVTIPSQVDGQRITDQIVVLPILDHRLQPIGKVSFQLRIITPFRGVSLEIGGAVETYWKSTTVPQTAAPSVNSQIRLPSVPSSMRSPTAASTSVNNLTVSSLAGEYVHVVVQATKDMVPVVCTDWRLPFDELELMACEVNHLQFQHLAKRKGKQLPTSRAGLTSVAAWSRVVRNSLISLDDLLRVLPTTYNVSLELAYPTAATVDGLGFGRSPSLNAFIDAVLQTVYHASQATPTTTGTSNPRRKVVFSSFEPDVCVALNWKQPNYAVLFATNCGVASASVHSSIAQFVPDESQTDKRCLSVSAAVNFAKANNLLGVILNASLLRRVPSLIRGIKALGVILTAFGEPEDIQPLPTSGAEGSAVDAVLQNGVLMYMDNPVPVVV